ncbi:extradiol dioxygenase [Burkholderia latens]|uniref:Extradiol dioxygenase n=1 Tax=Burkholderia latens TaxID=488446 RepID=A0AAP1CDJ7_9BURK|nr:VOC family protein [Burkholderia latens]KVA10045.1 extradiol dioxygenase [Burkholderia latens]
MHRTIFLSLPVADLPRASAFYVGLGFDVVPAYTSDRSVCVRVSDAILVMLLERPLFQSFTGKTIVDTATHVQVLPCLSCESPADVDAMVVKARAAGGTVPREPQTDAGMYTHEFADPDGHEWGLCAQLGAAAHGAAS